MLFIGLALIFLGTVLLLRNLGFLDQTVWDIFWPIFVILFGIAIAFRHLEKERKNPNHKYKNKEKE